MSERLNTSTLMSYKEIPFDLRLEILATALLDADFDFEQLVIHPKGLFLRNYKNDVLGMEETGEKRKEKKLHLSVSREGLYDTLPEGLFHENLKKSPQIDTAESVAEIKRHQAEEKAARKFFLPLEQEFFRLQIEAEILESNLLLSRFDRQQYEVFLDLWDIPDALSDEQIMLLLYIIPSLHRMVGNHRLIQLCLSLMLGVEVRLHPCPVPIPKESITAVGRLGSIGLGKDFVLGDWVENPYMGLRMLIGPVAKHTIQDYLAEGKSLALLHYLSRYFLPVHTEYTIELVIEKKEQEFYIESENTGSGILGYSTCL